MCPTHTAAMLMVTSSPRLESPVMHENDEFTQRVALAWLAAQLAWEANLRVLRGIDEPPPAAQQRPAA
jgi:hypothetical protein